VPIISWYHFKEFLFPGGRKLQDIINEKEKNSINSLFLLVEKRKSFQLKVSNIKKQKGNFI